MKQTIKKGFTLVELLFVMAIISILAGFAIANLNDSTEVAILNSMKSDLRGAINAQQTIVSRTGAYADMSCVEGVDDTNGMCTSGEFKVSISKGTGFRTRKINCTAQDGGGKGYNISIGNSKYKNGETGVYFNSCNHGSIKIISLLGN